MANCLHGCQSVCRRLHILHRPKASRLLQPVLQGQQAGQDHQADSQGGAECLRNVEDTVPGYESTLQRFQAAVYQRVEQGADGETIGFRLGWVATS